MMGVNTRDPHHEDGGEDEDDVEEGQAQQEDVDGWCQHLCILLHECQISTL